MAYNIGYELYTEEFNGVTQEWVEIAGMSGGFRVSVRGLGLQRNTKELREFVRNLVYVMAEGIDWGKDSPMNLNEVVRHPFKPTWESDKDKVSIPKGIGVFGQFYKIDENWGYYVNCESLSPEQKARFVILTQYVANKVSSTFKYIQVAKNEYWVKDKNGTTIERFKMTSEYLKKEGTFSFDRTLGKFKLYTFDKKKAVKSWFGIGG